MTTTPNAALALYEKACATHARKDWRQACHALAAVLQASTTAPADPVRELSHRPPEAAKERSLLEFLSLRGLKDAGGELRARDAELWHKAKPFRRRLIRDDGVSLETAALAAWEAGYFPHVSEVRLEDSGDSLPVSAAMLLEAINRELAGRALYPWTYAEPAELMYDPEPFDDDRWSATYGEAA